MIGTSPTSQRAPLVRSHHSTEISIEDIEAQVHRLRRGWPPGSSLQLISALFAMLRVGTNLPKLKSFTNYPTDLLLNLTDELRAHGQLLSGVPSGQFVLQQCPGSENLIKSLTGSCPPGDIPEHQAAFAPPAVTSQSKIRKESPVSESLSSAIKPVSESSEEVADTCTCGKISNHIGRCKGTVVRKDASSLQQASTTFHEVVAQGNGTATGAGLVREPPADMESVQQVPQGSTETPDGFRFSVSLKSPDGYYSAQGTTREEFMRAQKVLDLILAP